MTAHDGCLVNEDVFLIVDGGEMVAWNYKSGRKYALSLTALRALTDREFASTCPRIVEALKRADILKAAGTGKSWNWQWDALSRIFHFGTFHRRPPNSKSTSEANPHAYIEYCASIHASMPPDAFSTRRGAGDIPLRFSPRRQTPDLLDLLEARRTNRTFSGEAIAFEDVSEVLDETFRYREHDLAAFASAGLSTPTTRRSAPSGGSLQSCEAYLIARNVSGLNCGIYHYRSHERNIGSIRTIGASFSFGNIFLEQMFADNLSAAIVITCRLDKLMWKYPHSRAYRVALFDAGHLSQNVQLLATALGVRTWPTAAFFDEELAELLDLKNVDTEYPLLVIGLGAGEVNPLESDLSMGLR